MERKENTTQFNNEALRVIVSGDQMIQMFSSAKTSFMLEPRKASVAQETIKVMVRDVRRKLGEMYPRQIESSSGSFVMNEHVFNTLKNISEAALSITDHSDTLRLPETNAERKEFIESVADSVFDEKGIIFVAPVCPDYSKGELFYREMGEAISPEAQAAISAVKTLSEHFPKTKISTSFLLLVANTEDDKPEIIKNCVNGDIDRYKKMCEGSAKGIRNKLQEIDNVQVSTFTDVLGDTFRETQYVYEEKIRKSMESKDKFRAEVVSIGDKRSQRHSQILGRKEEDYELTVRYMAQYAALGSLAKRSAQRIIFLNYETPNRLYFNAAINRNKDIALSEKDIQKTIPVLGTVRGR